MFAPCWYHLRLLSPRVLHLCGGKYMYVVVFYTSLLLRLDVQCTHLLNHGLFLQDFMTPCKEHKLSIIHVVGIGSDKAKQGKYIWRQVFLTWKNELPQARLEPATCCMQVRVSPVKAHRCIYVHVVDTCTIFLLPLWWENHYIFLSPHLLVWSSEL